MRLLDTTTFELEEFLGENRPEYAILSHTWGEEEVTFQDLSAQAILANDSWKLKKSFKKVSGFCSLARESGYRWCWIDTCCIDKTSSAELSEAINSMFRWYAQSHVCFVYLSDVSVDHVKQGHVYDFQTSRWHKRGWTLQEMLAPDRVEFYDIDWNMFGTRFSLRSTISHITGIQEEVLTSRFDVEASKSQHCVAEKMAWASGRKTTRVEDLAYCLLGIFDINMPLLYGEGERAFERLQFQILTETEDLTLFAWQGLLEDLYSTSVRLESKLLAESPSDFHDARQYESLNPRSEITIQRLTDEPPTKRLGFFNLSVLLVSGSAAIPVLLVLARVQIPGERTPNIPWTTTGKDEYLCLPLASTKTIGGPFAFMKGGVPYRTKLNDCTSGIRFERISIQLDPNPTIHKIRKFNGATKPVTALIVFYQGEWCSPRLFYWDDVEYQSYAILLRHGSSPQFEFLVLCGWYADPMTAHKRIPWAVITNWEELSTARKLVPGAKDRGNAGDFPRREMPDGGNILCSIKTRKQEWCRPLQNSIAKSKFDELVNPLREVFSLNIQVNSAKVEAEKIEYMHSSKWANLAEFRDFVRSGSDGRAGFFRRKACNE